MKNKVKQFAVSVREVKKMSSYVYRLVFNSNYLAKAALPGNFIHVKVKGVILRRPFSIHKVEDNSVFLLFKVKGRGTRALCNYKKGESLDVIGPLGKGFKVSSQKSKLSCQNILIAGGIGVAPLMFLAQKISKKNEGKFHTRNLILLGGKNKNDIICQKSFTELGFKPLVATEDGSRGRKGNVIDLLRDILPRTKSQEPRAVYACGPEAMFRALNKAVKKYPNISCQVSFEQFMGCGIGTCCACTIETKNGYKKVCKDGPVFDINDIW
jgi:dihydroorotate dehydrogenase electron transfer subunit